MSADDPARRHILARRARFVAVALGAAHLVGCDPPAHPCLKIAPPRDAGVEPEPVPGADAAHGSVADSGTGELSSDAGAPLDAGTGGERDGGSGSVDAGTEPPDAGAPDAGRIDAGAPRRDAGTDLPPRVCLKMAVPPRTKTE